MDVATLARMWMDTSILDRLWAIVGSLAALTLFAGSTASTTLGRPVTPLEGLAFELQQLSMPTAWIDSVNQYFLEHADVWGPLAVVVFAIAVIVPFFSYHSRAASTAWLALLVCVQVDSVSWWWVTLLGIALVAVAWWLIRDDGDLDRVLKGIVALFLGATDVVFLVLGGLFGLTNPNKRAGTAIDLTDKGADLPTGAVRL